MKKTAKKTTQKPTAKKTQAKRTRTNKREKSTSPEKGLPKLSGTLKLEYEASFYKFESNLAKFHSKMSEIREKAQDPVMQEALKLLNEKEKLAREVATSQKSLTDLGKKVCDKFSIPHDEWKDYIVDTETGRVTYFPLAERGKKKEIDNG